MLLRRVLKPEKGLTCKPGSRIERCMDSVQCPAILIAAPASGQGKTTLTAALARLHTRQGKKVRVFKTGPDFIDPTIHQMASGQPVHQLDLWMVGEVECQRLLYQAACDADLILIEGVMGMFDGTPSSADLAKRFGIPILAVIDAGAMAQTFGALCHGLASYDPDLPMIGFVANRVASHRHGELLRNSLRPETRLLATLPKDPELSLPERHLGLQLAEEQSDLPLKLERWADTLAATELARLPAMVTLSSPVESTDQALPLGLAGVRIAVARDEAFAFVYPANLDLLQQLGASLVYFSPIHDQQLPASDALYFPGGYPELHLEALANNTCMKAAVLQAVQQRPTVAECGGMLYLLETLTLNSGERHELVGAIRGSARMGSKLAGLGSLKAYWPLMAEDERGEDRGELRGHTFHYSSFDQTPEFAGFCRSNLTGRQTEGLIQQERLLASYAHWYFPSNPALAVALFKP